jgi:alginate O-acetyltransferase complex protein AlgI
MIVFAMMIFFDLSGFCDMAMGLGRCFGMDLPQNFYFPFQSPSVSDFLDRFNMTITGFFRHYVYDVLRNDKNSRPQFIVNTLLITMLCGIWFGIEMNFIIWGLYIAAFIIFEEFFLNRVLKKIPPFFARVYTFVVTMFSMVIFSAKDVDSIFINFKAMFGIDASVITDSVAYIVSQNMLIIFVGAFFLISAFSMFVQYLSKKAPRLFGIFAILESFVLLTLITAGLI